MREYPCLQIVKGIYSSRYTATEVELRLLESKIDVREVRVDNRKNDGYAQHTEQLQVKSQVLRTL